MLYSLTVSKYIVNINVRYKYNNKVVSRLIHCSYLLIYIYVWYISCILSILVLIIICNYILYLYIIYCNSILVLIIICNYIFFIISYTLYIIYIYIIRLL